MNNKVEIRYKGQYAPLKKHTLKISAELVRDGYVYSSAQLAILEAICDEPEYTSLELPANLWETTQYGDRVFLRDWEVIMNLI